MPGISKSNPSRPAITGYSRSGISKRIAGSILVWSGIFEAKGTAVNVKAKDPNAKDDAGQTVNLTLIP